jgi:hypothetical protein
LQKPEGSQLRRADFVFTTISDSNPVQHPEQHRYFAKLILQGGKVDPLTI